LLCLFCFSDKFYLQCHESTCPGRAVAVGVNLTVTKDHTHAQRPEKRQKLEITSKLKSASEGSSQRLREIFNDVTRNDPQGHLVGFGTVESTMYRRRRGTQPNLPTSVPDAVAVLEENNSPFSSMPNGDLFYHGHFTAPDGKKGVIFTSTQLLQTLQASEEVHLDVTFTVVPGLFYQLVTVGVIQGDHVSENCMHG
jgi:hypothetical protein